MNNRSKIVFIAVCGGFLVAAAGSMQECFARSDYTPLTDAQKNALPVYRQGFKRPVLTEAQQTAAGQSGAQTQVSLGENKVLAAKSSPEAATIPTQPAYASEAGIFDATDSPLTDASLIGKSGDYWLGIVNDEHITSSSWIFADFTAAGQSYTIPNQVTRNTSTTQIFGNDWSQFIKNPSDYALRFISLGAGNTFDIVIEDASGHQIRFPIAGNGGILGANTSRNQTAIASFDWLKAKAPQDFDWSHISAFKVESTQSGWTLLTDIKIVEFNDAYSVAMGVAGHDLQGPGWRQRLDNYTGYAGQQPSQGTFYTTIFEPIREKNDANDHYSDTVERAQALIEEGVVPVVTLEFRSWAQIAQDQDKISLERRLFNQQNKGGISYDDFMNNYVNQNKVLDAVNAGLLDPLLTRIARQMKTLKEDVYVRLFHEPYWWFPWGMREQSDVQKFKDAWVHVGQIFEKAGADNVKFIMTLDPAEPGGSAWSEVTAIPSQYLAVVELDGYTDPTFRQNANLSANELFTKKLTEISWQLESLYPDRATRPTITIGEFAFSGGDYFTKEQAYDWFIADLEHRAYPVTGFSVLYTYQAGPRPSADALNYSPVQEGYWSAAWQPEPSWYSQQLERLDTAVGLWESPLQEKKHWHGNANRLFKYFQRFFEINHLPAFWKPMPWERFSSRR